MQPHCVGSLRKFARRMVPVAALFALAGVAYADQDVQSSDGQWKVHAKISDSLGVKKSSEAMVDISAAGMAKGCPKVASVAFEMPSHGHGGDVDPKAMSMGACSWHVTDLEPSMAGAWRLRLVLKDGDKTSNADISVTAK